MRTLATETEANIENHLSNLDSHFRPAPRATQVMVESLPFSMRKQHAAGGGGLGPQPTAGAGLARGRGAGPSTTAAQPGTVSMVTWPTPAASSAMEVNAIGPAGAHPPTGTTRNQGGRGRSGAGKEKKARAGGAGGPGQPRPCGNCHDPACPRCCFVCNSKDHLARHCPSRRNGAGAILAATGPQLTAAAPGRDGETDNSAIGRSGPPVEKNAGEEPNINWCMHGSGLFAASSRDASDDCVSCAGSEASFRHTTASTNILATGKGMRGALNIPTLVDSGFLSRSDCSILLNQTIFETFFAHLQVQVSAPPTTILTANGASLPLSLTFQGSLSINGDGGYVHGNTGEVFNVGVVPGLGKPCIIGTLAMARLGIATHPAPQMLSLADPGDCTKIMGWVKLERMETFTPYPADPADWPKMEQNFLQQLWRQGNTAIYG